MKGAKRCRCGGWIVFNDEDRTIRHGEPICPEFSAAMQAAGMKTIEDPWAEVVRPSDGSLVKPGSA